MLDREHGRLATWRFQVAVEADLQKIISAEALINRMHDALTWAEGVGRVEIVPEEDITVHATSDAGYGWAI